MMSSLLIQDVIVTLFALGACTVLFRRLGGIFSSEKDASPCSTCASCKPAVQEREPDVITVVPLSALRRPTGQN